MAKATAQDLMDAGFRAEQFGTPADFAAYVEAILADASTWASDRLGAAVYTDADGAAKLRIKRAEIAYAKAELWRRRAAFIDANAMSALEGGATAYLDRREYLAHAQAAEDEAQLYLDLAAAGGDTGAVGGGIAMGHAETGPFPVSSA